MTSPIDSRDSNAFLLEYLLAGQRSMSAVEQFASLHEAGTLDDVSEPAQAQYYRALLPTSVPEAGQQYGFSVDLDKCSGCKACVVACHTLNGLDEDEAWRRVGTVVTDDSRIQHVTTACHHCVEPGCLKGCPVKAYIKDSVTGIVRHLDDQCIGCMYCTMTCPYEVPQFNASLGIVRKCDMCSQRLARDEAPACVQSCPNGAIAITIVNSHTMTGSAALAPGAPSSSITSPTTSYLSARSQSFDRGVAQDIGLDHAAHNHWPLAVLLVGTQASVGLLAVERMNSIVELVSSGTFSMLATVTAWLVALISLAIGGLHLGQPLRAWRVFLGIGTSWLSREALVLGMYAGLISVCAAISSRAVLEAWLPTEFVASLQPFEFRVVARFVPWVTLVVGFAGLYCSAMVYVVTQRKLWRFGRTIPAFLLTTFIAGLALAVALSQTTISSSERNGKVVFLFLGAALVGAAWQVYRSGVAKRDSRANSVESRSRDVIKRELAVQHRLQVLSQAAAVLLAGLMLIAPMPAVVAWSIAGLVVASELLGRLTYFASMVSMRMPGTLK